MPGRSYVSLRDVARATGYSPATVSYALNHRGRISKERRDEILSAAERMGYRANKLIGAEASGKFGEDTAHRLLPIAMLTREPGSRRAASPMPAALRKEAERNGFAIECIDTLQHPDPQQLSRRLYDQGVQGLLLHRNLVDDDFWTRFDFRPFAVVNLDHLLHRRLPCFHHVRLSRFDHFQKAWRRCEQAGYRRIGTIFYAHPGGRPDNDRLLASQLLARERTQSRDRVPALTFRSFHEIGTARFEKRVQVYVEKKRPDCLLVQNPQIARLVRDFPVVTLTGAAGNLTGFRNLAARQHHHELTLLLRLIRTQQLGKQPHPHQVIVPGEWHAGRSLPKCNERSAS